MRTYCLALLTLCQTQLALAGVTDDAATIAARELAFSARAQVVDTRQAFREFFAHDAVGFNAGPGLAQPELARDLVRNPAPPPKFEWWPHAVYVSAAGDLGLSTGPGRGKAPDGTERWFFYSSVWQKQADGVYAVVIDHGVRIPTPTTPPAAWRRPASDPPRAPALAEAARRAAETAMWEADEALERRAESDPTAAYAAVASSEMRMHRRGRAPVVGRDAVDAELRELDLTHLEWHISGSRMAASGDFGLVWGTGSSQARSPEAKPIEFDYFRVWRKDVEGWRVLFDMANPQPPKPKP